VDIGGFGSAFSSSIVDLIDYRHLKIQVFKISMHCQTGAGLFLKHFPLNNQELVV
jgi:hypothetical protein